MKKIFTVCAFGLAVADAGAAVSPLSADRVAKIREYLAAQPCVRPAIDKANYGNREGVPGNTFYYGWTLDPLQKLKGFRQIGHLPDRDARDTSSNFLSAGLEMENILGGDIVPYLAAAGFKRARLNYAWRKIEKKKGVYDFSGTDAMVDRLLAAGIEPWFYGGYGNELYYGKVERKDPLAATFWDAPCYHGDEAVAGWMAFVKALAEHYKGRVRFYEIWNELDARWYKDGKTAHSQLGTTRASADFAKFYRRTMETMKSVDPEIKGGISLGSLDSPWAVGLARAGMKDILDVWTYHGYLRSPEEKVLPSLAQMRALYRRADGSLPEIAMGECARGAGPALTARVSTRTEYAQAKFVVRRMFFDLSAGAQFCNIFNVGSQSYGIFKPEDKSPRLAYYVIKSLSPIFDGLVPAPDMVVSLSPRGPQTMTPQTRWNALELHAFRRKGVPVFTWWQPEHLDIEGEALYGKLLAQSGCDKADNLPNPIVIDPIRRIVWDVKEAVWSGIAGVDHISIIPATNYPYIFTDLSIFDEYVND